MNGTAKVTKIEACYRVTTPMFCGGANPDQTAELRLPSFKGVLRFWWRALAWRRLGGDLKRIKKEEDRLFGSAGGGQSRVVMSMSRPQCNTFVKGEVLSDREGHGVVGPGVRYLGYGLMEAFASKKKQTQAGQLTRPCLRPPFDFTVWMRVREPDGGDVEELLTALKALGTLGAMGARSRKGFGSLSLRSLLVDGSYRWKVPANTQDLAAALESLRPDRGTQTTSTGRYPEITALSDRTRFLVVGAGRAGAVELLDRIGCELVRYRSWGHNGRVLEAPSERNFKADHDLMKKRHWQRDGHPTRISFGLPHNYGKRQDMQVGPDQKDLDRRASPLFIHIHECQEGPAAVLSLLPSKFLPGRNPEISVGGKRVPLAAYDQLYQPVHSFLDRLRDPNRRKERFESVQEVPVP